MFIVDSYDIAVAFCLIACAMSRLDCVRVGGVESVSAALPGQKEIIP